MLSTARGEVDEPTYHVLLDGRTVGPYDRRTIVGMRIKHMLTGDHLLVATGGAQLTVRDLVGGAPAPDAAANPGDQAGRVQATYTGMVLEAGRGGFSIPRFKGEVEVRLQGHALRVAGRCRQLWRWKERRIKLPLTDVVHVHAKGPRAELWLQRAGSTGLQRLGLYLFTAEAASELATWLTPAADAAPHPALDAARAAAAGDRPLNTGRVLAIAVLGIASVIVLVLVVLLRRVY